MVTLCSSDGKNFIINKDVACVSKHLAQCFSGGFAEGQSREVKLNITHEILEVCVKYMHYQLIYRDLPVHDRP